MINISEKRKYLFSRYLILPISFSINHHQFKIFQPKSFPFSKVSLNSRSVTKHFVLETYYVELRLSYPTNSLSILLPATEIAPSPQTFAQLNFSVIKSSTFGCVTTFCPCPFPLLDSRNLNLCETHVKGMWR